MAITLNLFDLPKLTDEEKLNGFIFHELQTSVLKTELVTVIHQLANLKLNPANLLEGALEQAYLNGQLELLQTLLNRSEESQSVMLQIAAKQAQQQQSDSSTF